MIFLRLVFLYLPSRLEYLNGVLGKASLPRVACRASHSTVPVLHKRVAQKSLRRSYFLRKIHVLLCARDFRSAWERLKLKRYHCFPGVAAKVHNVGVHGFFLPCRVAQQKILSEQSRACLAALTAVQWGESGEAIKHVAPVPAIQMSRGVARWKQQIGSRWRRKD